MTSDMANRASIRNTAAPGTTASFSGHPFELAIAWPKLGVDGE